MSTENAIDTSIETAASSVGTVWPLHSFVTANPLAGFEDQPFHDAVQDGTALLGGNGYPHPDWFRQAWEAGRIDDAILRDRLASHPDNPEPEPALERMDAAEQSGPAGGADASDRVDSVLTKWLGAFLDTGRAQWAMPNRSAGFYAAVRELAPHDSAIPDGDVFAALPAEPEAAIRELLGSEQLGDWQSIFEYQLAQLPGWTGYLKRRRENPSWQDQAPISLAGYLAVRLALVDQFEAPLSPPEDATDESAAGADSKPLAACWLEAWEASYRTELVAPLTEASASQAETERDGRPAAQLVFCIDTRSEIIRRHIEAAGSYETFGYAGFFGVPMRYDGYDAAGPVDACPPIVDAEHRIAEHPSPADGMVQDDHDSWRAAFGSGLSAMINLSSNPGTAFSFVETTGLGYGSVLAGRTLFPSVTGPIRERIRDRIPDPREFCDLSLDYNPDSVNELREGLTLDEKVDYAATAFELLGVEEFARLFVFTGHASQTANNPFDSSLDCGACAGNPGGPNARTLAAICNDADVQAALRERGIDIPEDTVFVAAEHNTTTDEVDLFTDPVPASHADDIATLAADLETARSGAAAERAADLGADPEDARSETARRATDWAEPRPEWGLAGNAGFVVGPRSLTDDLNLDGRVFLHSYNWRTDDDGDALAAILAGPMVVTQWINMQYYFATVDTAAFGSGSKVTQNPVGNVGVYQGNGGDLMSGLPSQSVKSADDEPYHQPLRLSTVIHAPVARVTAIMEANDPVRELLDNGWLSLTVIDPTQEHAAVEYTGSGSWTPLEPASSEQTPATVDPQPADD
jgi:uncharacterized protein YbcC (UPF0753/DUF2309 family)